MLIMVVLILRCMLVGNSYCDELEPEDICLVRWVGNLRFVFDLFSILLICTAVAVTMLAVQRSCSNETAVAVQLQYKKSNSLQ